MRRNYSSLHNKTLGNKGEAIAVDYLREKGLVILAQNVSSRWGEIDIVATRGETLVFVEVKTKTGFTHGSPYEAVTYKKLESIKRAAQFYIMKHNRPEVKYAIDVVSITLSTTGEVIKIQHFDNIEL